MLFLMVLVENETQPHLEIELCSFIKTIITTQLGLLNLKLKIFNNKF